MLYITSTSFIEYQLLFWFHLKKETLRVHVWETNIMRFRTGYVCAVNYTIRPMSSNTVAQYVMYSTCSSWQSLLTCTLALQLQCAFIMFKAVFSSAINNFTNSCISQRNNSVIWKLPMYQINAVFLSWLNSDTSDGQFLSKYFIQKVPWCLHCRWTPNSKTYFLRMKLKQVITWLKWHDRTSDT